MEQKYYQNTHGRDSSIEHTYVDFVNDGFQIRIIGFEGEDFDTTIWIHPYFVNFIEYNEHYIDNPITVDSSANEFFWLAISVCEIIYLKEFNSQHKGWPYARILVERKQDGTVNEYITDGLIGR
jgi:hypothetical protein